MLSGSLVPELITVVPAAALSSPSLACREHRWVLESPKLHLPKGILGAVYRYLCLNPVE